ncbi:MAG: hypothetical protein ACOCRK_01970 [bacterium]
MVIVNEDAYKLYASELDKTSYENYYGLLINESPNDFGKRGNKSDSIVGKVSVKLISAITNKMQKIKVQEIMDSKGDIKRLKYYKDFERLNKLVQSYQKGMSTKSKYANIYLDTFTFVTKRRREFMKSFKNNEENVMSLFYAGLVLYMIEMATILSSSLLEWAKEGTDLDKTIGNKKEFKTPFIKIENLLSDDGMKKFFKIDFSKELIGESDIFNGEFITLYSEASLNDTLRIFSMGLAYLLYKITAFLRYIVYLFFYGKFSLEKKIEKINNTLDLYSEKDSEKRKRAMDEATKEDRQYKVATIEAVDDAEKQIKKDKVEIEDEEGFKL